MIGCDRSTRASEVMGSSDYSGEDDKNEVMQIHPDRHGADPTEGWRRGTRGTLRKSCDACTNSKTKCCGDIPCDRCKKRGLECKFRSAEIIPEADEHSKMEDSDLFENCWRNVRCIRYVGFSKWSKHP